MTIGDDHKMKVWSAVSQTVVRVFDLPSELFPIDLHASKDILVLSTSDGSLHLLNGKTGRIEKSVEGHSGCSLSVRWSPDSSAIASSGEDGLVKIFSKTLLLRSTFSMQSNPVYSLSWSPSSHALVFASSTKLEIKELSPKSKPIAWKAHDALILCVSWSKNGTIVSGSEDRRFKIWDAMARLLFQSDKHDFPLNCLSISPDSSLIAIGSFNLVKLVSSSGWSLHDKMLSNDKRQVNTIYSLSWSSDGGQVCGVSSSGHVVLSVVVDFRLEYKTWQLLLKERKVLQVKDVLQGMTDDLEFKDSVIRMSISFGHLIVLTTSQGIVYKLGNKFLSSSYSFDPKTVNPHLVLQSVNCFLISDAFNVIIYSYEGKVISNVKWSGMRAESLDSSNISLSPDMLAVKEDKTSVLLIESSNSKFIKKVLHSDQIINVSLSQGDDRSLCFIDKNNDVFIHSLSKSSSVKTIKLASMMKTVKWHEEVNILSGISENDKLIIWSLPSIAFLDRDLLEDTRIDQDISVKNAEEISQFVGSSIVIKVSDGTRVTESVSLLPLLLVLHSKTGKEGVNLCRLISDQKDRRRLWSTFTGLALMSRNLDLIETAYQEVERIDKVLFIQKMKAISDPNARNAEMLVLTGNLKEAEAVMINSAFILRAILLNVSTFDWRRALELAVSADDHQEEKTLIRIVLSLRKEYLEKQGIEVENMQEMIEAEDSLAEETGFVVLEAKKLKSLTINPYEYKRSSVRIVSASKK